MAKGDDEGSATGSVHSTAGSIRSVHSDKISRASRRRRPRAAGDRAARGDEGSVAGSVRSIYSDEIVRASRRGAERAGAEALAARHEGQAGLPAQREKKHRKQRKSKRRSRAEQDAVRGSATGTGRPDDDDDEGWRALPTTTAPLRLADLAGAAAVGDGRSFASFSSRGSAVSLASLESGGSGSLASRRRDKDYLRATAAAKFAKGLRCAEEGKHALARSKFRAALKARVLLHGDVNHLSLSLVHEMLGIVERNLEQWEKSRLHIMAALEICEKGLARAEGGEGGGGGERVVLEGMEHVRGAAREEAPTERQTLRINVARLRATLAAVEAEKEAAAQDVGDASSPSAKIPSSDARRQLLEETRRRRQEREREAAVAQERERPPEREVAEDAVAAAGHVEATEDGNAGPPPLPPGFGGGGLASIREGSSMRHLPTTAKEDAAGPPPVPETEPDPAPPARYRLGNRRMSTTNADSLRARYRKQCGRGEVRYERGDHAKAATYFQDAKFALLMIAGVEDDADEAAKWRDQINSVRSAFGQGCGGVGGRNALACRQMRCDRSAPQADAHRKIPHEEVFSSKV